MGAHHPTSSSSCCHDRQCPHPLTQSPGRVRQRKASAANPSIFSSRPGDKKTVPPSRQPCHSHPMYHLQQLDKDGDQENGYLCRVCGGIRCSPGQLPRESVSEGQRVATPQARAAFSSSCRSAESLVGRLTYISLRSLISEVTSVLCFF